MKEEDLGIKSELPKGWVKTTVKEVISDYQAGFASGKKDVENGLNHLRMNNIDIEGKIDLSLLRTVPVNLAKERHYLQEGDILVCTTNSAKLVGKSAVFNLQGDFVFSNHLTRLRTSSDYINLYFLQKYLFYIWKQEGFESICKHWVNQSTIPKEKLLLINIPLPPVNEQRRIVAKLEKIIAKINTCQERLERIPTILKRFRQSVLAAACSGRLTADWREQHPDVEPAEELLKRIHKERKRLYEEDCAKAKGEGKRKPKKLRDFYLIKEHNFEIPQSWTVSYPEHICSNKDYSIGIGPFGSNLKVSDYRENGVPLVFVRHIRSNNFIDLNPKYISDKKAQDLLPHMVEPLDLLITKMGEPPGDCEIYPANLSKAVITADCLKFRIWDTDLERVFFKHCINSYIVKEQLGLITKGVAQQKISVERFKSILIPVPPLEEQQEIVRKVEALFKKCDAIEQRYQKAKNYTDRLTQSILAKAFRGELVPQDPNDEPAEILLERIRAEKAEQEKQTKAKKKTKRKTTSTKKRSKIQPRQLEIPDMN